MANSSSEMKNLINRVWNPAPVVGISDNLARFINKAVLGEMRGTARTDIIAELTINPNYQPLDNPEVTSLNDYIGYTKFVVEVLPKHPRFKQPLIDIWSDVCALTNPFYDLLRGTGKEILVDLDAVRRTESLDTLVLLGLIDPNNARFLSRAVKYNPRHFKP